MVTCSVNSKSQHSFRDWVIWILQSHLLLPSHMHPNPNNPLQFLKNPAFFLMTLGSYTAVSFIQNVFPSVVCLTKLCTTYASCSWSPWSILRLPWVEFCVHVHGWLHGSQQNFVFFPQFTAGRSTDPTMPAIQINILMYFLSVYMLLQNFYYIIHCSDLGIFLYHAIIRIFPCYLIAFLAWHYKYL